MTPRMYVLHRRNSQTGIENLGKQHVTPHVALRSIEVGDVEATTRHARSGEQGGHGLLVEDTKMSIAS